MDELSQPELAGFGSTRLVAEMLLADLEVRAAKGWKARHAWLCYRERVAGWRYLTVRGIDVYRVTQCRCERLVRFQYNRRAICFACGRKWWVFLKTNGPRAQRSPLMGASL